MMVMNHVRPVAVACQGGGSHTAFTAGVLETFLADPGVEIRALSGTSGGAVCAALAWSGIVTARVGQPADDAIARLRGFWADNTTPLWEVAQEAAVVAAMRLVGELGVTPEFSAYRNPWEAHEQFIEMLARHVPFGELGPERLTDDDPRLLVSAADVRTGEFRVFRSHPLNGYAADRITALVILASAALPTVFRAVPLCGGLYWDGGFTQNPPVRELIRAARRPGAMLNEEARNAAASGDAVLPGGDPGGANDDSIELWIIQINPEARASEPVSMDDIRDRRNELTGNISFQQEVSAIGLVNRLSQRGCSPAGPCHATAR
jgi:NTE family protein